LYFSLLDFAADAAWRTSSLRASSGVGAKEAQSTNAGQRRADWFVERDSLIRSSLDDDRSYAA
jgi:hypothetical protein